MSKYQLLPALNAADLAELKASIQERGVVVPVVVDETGEIIDGHNRVMIADSLGIEYPKDVRAGLPEYEKRILAAELNRARRQMTDAQMVRLGQQIEPDIAARAEARRLANLRQGAAPNASRDALGEPVKRTSAEIARTVGLGSASTYERGKQVIEQIEREEDAPLLLQAIDNGDWQLDDARKELRRREAERERDAFEAAIKRSPEEHRARMEKARVRRVYMEAAAEISGKLTPLNPASVVACFEGGDADAARRTIASLRDWLDRLESELNRTGFRVIGRKEA